MNSVKLLTLVQAKRVAITSIFVCALFFGLAGLSAKVHAQASCSALNTGYGSATYNLTGVTSGSHSLWLRVKGSDSTPSLKYNISGGGSSCAQTMAATGASAWKWVKSTGTFSTTGGTVTLEISANEAGVGLDCLVLTSVTSFAPTDASGCAGPQVDSTAPSASITAPANNASVSGQINITATASDAESGVQNVTFNVSGRSDLTVVDTTAPYERALDTSLLNNGSVTLTIVATNGAGLTTTVNRTITVNNTVTPPPDTTKPTVSITSPADGSTVNGSSLLITANASDNVGVNKVDLYVDGVFKLSDTTSPYSFSVSGLSDGVHQIYATASDASNNAQQSAVISVTTKQFKDGDINGDGSVNLSDFFIMRTNFGQTGKTRAQGDLTGDGSVTLADFFVLRQNFGK